MKEQSLRLHHLQPYKHPLSSHIEENGETLLNMWSMVSFMINTVRNVYNDGDPQLAETNLKIMINRINPLVDANYLLSEIKLHKVAAIQKVANIIGTASHESIVNSTKNMKLLSHPSSEDELSN